MKEDMNCTRKGSITLETLISFTVFLIFCLSMVSMTAFYRSDILMQRAVQISCKEFSLLTPLSVTASDTLSTIINVIPSGTVRSDSVIATAAKVAGAIDMEYDGALTELLMNGMLSHKMADDIAANYIELNNGSDYLLPDVINVDVSLSDNHSMIEVNVEYRTDTFAGEVTRNVYSIIPFYGYFDLFLNGSSQTPSGDDEAWGRDNFTRGDYFRKKFGMNLPSNFPVIDSFKNGTATSVLSIDLTAPTYSDPDEVNEVIQANIMNLSAFDGDSITYAGEEYTVDGDDIRKKVLIVVIPENSPEGSDRTFPGLKRVADAAGVVLQVERCGNSYKYA